MKRTQAKPRAQTHARRSGRPHEAAATAGADPAGSPRELRSTGRERRSQLLDAASRLFRQQGLSAVSIADIANAVDAFPSQITYYFRTKEALFVEAACRELLYLGRTMEREAGKQMSPQAYSRALVEQVMHADALGFFIEALVLTRRRQDLAPLVERTIERLHGEGLRAYADVMTVRGWRTQSDPSTTARRFWTLAIGVALEGQATGRNPRALCEDLLHLIGAQAHEPDTASHRLRVVPPTQNEQ